MKSFRTELVSKTSNVRLGHSRRMLTLGSCFAQTIGECLVRNKFNAIVNPLGTIYNPLSIHEAMQLVIDGRSPAQASYLENQGQWFNYQFHSSFSGASLSELRDKIDRTVQNLHPALRQTDVLLITYGTSNIFHRADNSEPVANCHKMPGNLFVQRTLSPEETIASFESLYHNLKLYNPRIQIILTVSPVRHTRDTLPRNGASKAALRWSCEVLQDRHDDVTYFPAYEILMDDLRDYRFYESDMIHPSSEAVDYIWEKFSETFFDSEVRNTLRQWQEIRAALQHRPFQPRSHAHVNFLRETVHKLEQLNGTLTLNEEIAGIRSQLKDIE